MTTTNRPTSEYLESILDEYTPILDHGFIGVKDYMGNDSSILQMARTSYGKGTKVVNDDRALLRYLMRHKHTSPFEGCEIKLHLKMPIFVMRQFVRHRTASLNEISGRYSVLPEEFYIPELTMINKQSTDNKQGRGDLLSDDHAGYVRDLLITEASRDFRVYNTLLGIDKTYVDAQHLNAFGEFDGIARELARINLPLSTYTELYWKIDLHNLLHFLRLRMDTHAQYEIRIYANVIYDIIKQWVPVTVEAFNDYVLNSYTCSRMEVELLKIMIPYFFERFTKTSDVVTDIGTELGMTKREIQEFMNKFIVI